MSEHPTPRHCDELLIHQDLRDHLNTSLASNTLESGWMIVGPPHIGKATLAYTLARTLLSGQAELGQSDTTTDALIQNGAHPDLFVLEREVNEKTGKLRNDISVDQVRKVTAGLHQTSTTGRRVVIVDLADDLGREAANALLKTLEEPPSGTSLFLLSAAPGRLLPTIKSRCRQMTMVPFADDALGAWASQVTGKEGADLTPLIDDAAGRPGRIRVLAEGEGETARDIADRFFTAVEQGQLSAFLTAASKTVGADADAAWPDARQLILERISRKVRAHPDAPHVLSLLKAYDHIRDLSARAHALNSDRQHTVIDMALTLRDAGWRDHAGR